ncbi:hypothetical protein [Bradyrhizobium sp. DOA1]|uniref:hypothetical protein n=1 Tax=Bradyrhizobium sp. DOA1 TaxID=1126616 RepID=UPI00077C726A|nr:hypothetical protein [Bradyrhizobium sp. DOA1]KYG97524.1 hypothetical protein SE91_02160 [Bradyrhizobium sp. DOA1]
MFILSDLIIIQGIFRTVGIQDFADGQRRLIKEVTDAANNLLEFAKSFTKAVWLEHFDDKIICDRLFDVVHAPIVDDLTLPFFVTLP